MSFSSEVMDFKVDSEGWIEGVVEYEGCGSHAADWTPEGKAWVEAIPYLLNKLLELGIVPSVDCTTGKCHFTTK